MRTPAPTEAEHVDGDPKETIDEAVAGVDRCIAQLSGQSLADTGTVIDMLLDLRAVLTR